MYFWKIELLKEDLRQNKLTEKDRFIYFLITMVFAIMMIEAISYLPIENPNTWDLTDSMSSIVVALAGLFFAFKANGGSSGSDFLGRYFSISFVVSIRFLGPLIALVIAQLAYYYYYQLEAEGFEEGSTWVDVVPFLVWEVLLYIRICKHIGDSKTSDVQ